MKITMNHVETPICLVGSSKPPSGFTLCPSKPGAFKGQPESRGFGRPHRLSDKNNVERYIRLPFNSYSDMHRNKYCIGFFTK